MIDVQNELKTDGAFQIFTEPGSVARRNTPITSMENYRRSFQKKNLWTPVTSEFLLFCPRIIPDYIARGFVVEKHTIDNDREAGGPDLFGAVWEWVPQVQGSMVRPGLPPLLPDIKEWEKHIIFPDPDGFDWAGSLKDNGAYLSEERPTIMWFMNGLFERLISFMSFEDAALALVVKDQKPAVHALLERLCDFYEEIFARYQSYYKANIIYLHDDWGGQYSPFFSPATVREMILPYLKRIVDFLHARGMYLHFHSCGKIELLVPAMIEAGVDVWCGQPINDRLAVLKEYGGRIKLEAEPLAFDKTYTEEEIKPAVTDFLDLYGPYINDIIVLNHSNKEEVYELVYAYSRKKLAT